MSAPHPRTARSGDRLRILRAAVFAAACVVLAAAGHTLASCAPVPLWTLGAGFLGATVLVAPLAGRQRSLPGIVALLAFGQTALHVLFGLAQHGTAAMASGAAATGSTGSTGSMGAMGSVDSTGGMSDATLVEQAARLVCGAGAAAISPAHAYRILADARLIDGSGATHHPAAAIGSSGASGASSDALLPSLPMLLGHVLAALAVGWLLRRGDLALLRLMHLSAHGVAEAALVRSLRGALALTRALRGGLRSEPDPGPRHRRTARNEAPAPHGTALQHSVVRRGPPAVTALVLAA
ncbi:hypothetical protein [Streptomyces shenzhenensis]|uniref:Integral membrane protein n=1 Tax=Streptomyces shenzhenensis TaxID=943815 RepID=A0A3M0IU66_9ACTN|nr:hypothetical protein [Streptomyces shenzhenensis]RMB85726.1 hypothetical protein CTZ28_13205 [Streptomyces shenzhenensis]